MRDSGEQKSAGPGILGGLQNSLKKYGRLYYFLVNILGPVRPTSQYTNRIKQLLKENNTQKKILNLGSGPTIFQGRTDIINVDLFPFKEVDIIADAINLPFRDDSIDLIINAGMLEHVPNPAAVVAEMFRICKHGGQVISYCPFMQPFHAAPHDYQRWTETGVQKLFSRFQEAEVALGGGPTCGMLWVFQEWLATLLSFGSTKIHDLVYLALLALLFPVKYLDVLVQRMPNAKNAASGFYITARKRPMGDELDEGTK